MTIYKDAPDADWEKNPMKYEIEKKTINKKDSIKIKTCTGWWLRNYIETIEIELSFPRNGNPY